MKLLVALMMCVAVMAAPNTPAKLQFDEDFQKEFAAIDSTQPESRNIAVNLLIRQLIVLLRSVINNGSIILGIPPLDPLDIENFHLKIPAGLINLDLQLADIHASGFGGFVVHRSASNMRDFSVDLDISVPNLDIKAGKYDLLGDILTAIPVYGKGDATFVVKDFRLQAKLYLGQSEDGTSIIIEKIDNVAFQLPHFESGISGAIGGGDIDAIVNAIIEDVIIDYVNRFQGAIGLVGAQAVQGFLNPVLEMFDSWRFIAPFV